MCERDEKAIKNCFSILSQESRELYLPEEVQVLEEPPSALEFLRNWVTPNIPVIIKGATDGWKARKHWNNEYLRRKIGNKEITVSVTPNGYADSVVGDDSDDDCRFVMAEDRTMNLNEFLDIIEGKRKEQGIFYIQKQNSNLTEEYPELLEDVEVEIPWCSDALDKKPDAVNLWIGDERAVTSMHKDPYENLYCVLSGEKHFILLPPTDLPYITYKDYRPAKYEFDEKLGEFSIVDIQNTDDKNDFSQPDLVPWIPIDPLDPDFDKYPRYKNARPIHCTVRAGETLYLPSLWFHHVRQSHGAIAVNFWYDMEYDVKYSYFKFLEEVVNYCKDA